MIKKVKKPNKFYFRYFIFNVKLLFIILKIDEKLKNVSKYKYLTKMYVVTDAIGLVVRDLERLLDTTMRTVTKRGVTPLR